MSTGSTAPPPFTSPRRYRKWLASAAILLILATVMTAVLLTGKGDSPPATIQHRAAPIEDLLAWIPANSQTEDVFSVWTPDPGGAASAAEIEQSPVPDALALEPFPRTLGRSPGWEQTFGWDAGRVGSWATAGPEGEIAILVGDFDVASIEDHLVSAGFDRTTYRGYSVFTHAGEPLSDAVTNGDAPASAASIAIVDGRLVTAVSEDLVHSAIDTIHNGTGSIADLSPVHAVLRTLAPLNGLTAMTQSEHAAACIPRARAVEIANPGYVFVGYGRIGEGGVRRTLVSTSLASVEEAAQYATGYENGWYSGFANAGGAGGSISSFGTLTSVSQSGSLLVAELVDGRDSGWIRSGIRYALPVCDLSLALSPAATPVAGSELADLTIEERLIVQLPIIELDGERRTIVLEQADSLTATPAPPVTLEVFSLDQDNVAKWESAFELDFSNVRGIGEVIEDANRPPVGVLIGSWDRDRLTAHLAAIGYDWIDFGDVRHFAYVGDNVDTALPGPQWKNLALYGDHMWFSADQRLMRDVIDAALNA